jgi:hypothetical protein
MEEQRLHTEEHHPHHHVIAVIVNNREVAFHARDVTGAEIKETAISQGVPIKQDFNLFHVKHEGGLKPIGDAERVQLHEHEKFRAVSPDDCSGPPSHDA